MENILYALIVGGLSLMGTLYATNKSSDKIQTDLKLEFTRAQAITDTKIEALTREVREHNNFAKRVPVLELQVARNQSDIAELSEYHKEPH
jgi:hypothetical protein